VEEQNIQGGLADSRDDENRQLVQVDVTFVQKQCHEAPVLLLF